ncbi:CDP-alcohol phosphatidyltransferase family protein [Microbacterium sp. B2969]|uniref:CDP-alcohol phosphatidyltransferase family protein n=1 Tax=Microbacterium alkaliflavum TaxID=3248839 RepID=A0ABW7QFI1_9MICO
MPRPGLADAITIGNALSGAAALGVVILMPWAEDAAGETATLRIVALLVLMGVVFDVCDGAVARARGGTPLGQHLDSLADVATFGVATALAVGGLAARHAAGWEAVALGVSVLAYVTAMLVRLADFDAGRNRDPSFLGMPSPLAAVTALSVGLLALPAWLTAVGITVVAWLMVSGIRYPRSRGVGLMAEAAGLAIAVAGIVGLIDVRIPASLTILGCVVVAPLTFALVTRRRRRAEPVDIPVERLEP